MITFFVCNGVLGNVRMVPIVFGPSKLGLFPRAPKELVGVLHWRAQKFALEGSSAMSWARSPLSQGTFTERRFIVSIVFYPPSTEIVLDRPLHHRHFAGKARMNSSDSKPATRAAQIRVRGGRRYWACLLGILGEPQPPGFGWKEKHVFCT